MAYKKSLQNYRFTPYTMKTMDQSGKQKSEGPRERKQFHHFIIIKFYFIFHFLQQQVLGNTFSACLQNIALNYLYYVVYTSLIIIYSNNSFYISIPRTVYLALQYALLISQKKAPFQVFVHTQYIMSKSTLITTIQTFYSFQSA